MVVSWFSYCEHAPQYHVCFVLLFLCLLLISIDVNHRLQVDSTPHLSFFEDTAHCVSAPTTSQRVQEYSNEEATGAVPMAFPAGTYWHKI